MDKKLTDSGAKARQREDSEWRAKQYSDWHRTLDKSLLMSDVDFIEWRFIDRKLVAVGVMEVSRADNDKDVNQGYLNAIIRRYEERDLQKRTAVAVAQALNTKAWIVLFREDCSEFWVYNLTSMRGWWHRTPVQMKEFLKSLKPGA